jgi:hypothetical protein
MDHWLKVCTVIRYGSVPDLSTVLFELKFSVFEEEVCGRKRVFFWGVGGGMGDGLRPVKPFLICM